MSTNSLINKLKTRAKELKQNISLIYSAYKHPDTPWYAKIIIIITIAYALSPIDLIPDFIPVLGYLDDLILIPAGIALSLKLIPKEVLEECKQRTQESNNIKSKGIYAAIIIILFWLLIISLILKTLKII